MGLETRSCEFTRSVILEIGTGGAPFPSIGKRVITANEYYVGIDNFMKYPTRPLFGPTYMLNEASAKHEGHLYFVITDGRQLPFADNGVSEVVLCNVFGDERVKRRNLTQIMRETRRVLKDDGLLTVVECRSLWVFPLRKAYSFMHQLGFECIDHGLMDREKIPLYGGSWSLPGAYAATFRKVKS